MTGLRIYHTANPMSVGGPVLPMSKVDADFWRLRRERARPVAERGEGA